MEQLEECEALLFDGYDEALIGIGGAFNQRAAVYDRQKIIDKLVAEGLSHHDAEEWLEVNMVGAYVGERTPIVVEMRADE